MRRSCILAALALATVTEAVHFTDFVRKSANVTCHPCLDEELQCNNCRCVLKEYYCDYVNDCGDFTDEPFNCSVCSGSMFSCRDRSCVPHSKVCDGNADCADNSDESDCAETLIECEKPRFRCNLDNKCKSLSEICAGFDKCDDDDTALCEEFRRQDNATSCYDKTCPSPGYQCDKDTNMVDRRCHCTDGFVVNENDTSKCRDFNECNVFGTCDQKCINTHGGFKCSCEDWYTLQENRKCVVTSGEQAKLYVGTSANITRMNLDGSQQEHVFPGNIGDLDFDVSSKSIFWIDADKQKVYRANISGEEKDEVITQSLPKPCSISYDYIGKNLYIVDCLARKIVVLNVQTGRQSTVIGDGIQVCKSVVVDPTEGYMFFTDYGRSVRHLPRISRAYMDGTNRVDLPVGRVVSPSSLSLDTINRRIYWTDSRLDRIQTVDYNGLRREVIVSGGLNIPAPVSLAMFEDRLYWADITKMAVLKVGKFGNQTARTVRSIDATLSTVKVYNPVLQNSARRSRFHNPCLSSPCSQLCVLSHTDDNGGLGYRCLCEAGYTIGPNGTSCQSITEFLMFSTKHSIRAIPLEGVMSIDAIKPINGQTNKRTGNSFVAIDYDSRRQEIYFSDIFNKAIFSSYLKEAEIRPAMAKDVRSVEGISLDWISRNLYYTDFFAKTVSVMRLDYPDQNRILLKNLGSPRSVAVHPAKGYVFFADWLKDLNSHPFIGRCEGDGSNVTEIRRYELGWPNGMCVDYDTDRVYWVDAYFDRLQHSDLDGKDLQTVAGIKLVHPFGVAVFKDFIYLSDWKLQTIYRMGKTSGETTPLLTGVQFLRSVRVYSEDMQKVPKNHPCAQNNGGCSHFCFPVTWNRSIAEPESGLPDRRCGCPYGWKLTADSKTCEVDTSETTEKACNGSSKFLCNTGRCIPAMRRCDGDDDCMDNSDEEGCDADKTCSPDRFQCNNGKCLSFHWKCDGDNDCGDMSDETQCPNKQCAPQEFKCNNTLCIHIRLKCNTDNDCGDGSDEGDFCADHACHLGYYQCNDNSCIPERKRCDGEEDCPAGEDENQCQPLQCAGDSMKCLTVRQCIPPQYRCDGVEDCRDSSDEKNCPLRPEGGCHKDEFKCGTGGCIPNKWRCDVQPDCEDGTDEMHCGSVSCSPDDFRCKNGRCIPRDFLCDQNNDCGDNSDEATSEGCPSEPFSCLSGQWVCPVMQSCINTSSVCDGRNDCPGGEDEICARKRCTENNGGCSHRCIDTPHGARCACPEGYALDWTRNCVDIDECRDPSSCSQACVNVKGSYKCSCEDGYQKLPNSHQCAAMRNVTIPKMLMCTHSHVTVTGVDIWNMVETLPVPGARALAGLDLHVEQKRIYLSDSTAMKVFSMNIDGSNITEVLTSGINVIEDLAVDWVGGNLYWNDYTLETVEVARLDGSNRIILFSENVSHPRGIELDPREGHRFIFWSDWGQNPRIERAGMDGSGRTTIISTKLYWPNGLSLDYPNKRLYFADARMDYIEFCNYDGSGRRQVIASDHFLRHPHDLVVFEDYIIWTDRAANRISRCNKYNCTNKDVIGSKLNKPIGVAVYHPVRQPKAPNPCTSHPCSHICLLSPVTDFKCGCPMGMYLPEPRSTQCVKLDDVYLLYGYENGVTALDLPVKSKSESIYPLTTTKTVLDIDFDSATGTLFLVQEGKGGNTTLKSLKMFSSNESYLDETLFSNNPAAIAYDWVSKNLWWVDRDSGTIEVMRLHGKVRYRKILQSNMGRNMDCVRPTSVVVDPDSGYLYWADLGGHGSRPKIASVLMNGSRRKIISQRRVDQPTSLALDSNNGDLYWTEGRLQQIMKWDARRRSITRIHDAIGSPHGLVVYRGKLYFAMENFATLNAIELKSGYKKTVLKRNLEGLKTVEVYYDRHSKAITNGCGRNNGGCAQLCLPSGPRYHQCECGVGFEKVNGACHQSNTFLVVSQQNVIRGFDLYRGNHDDDMAPIGGVGRNAVSVDVHMAGRHIYWADAPATNSAGGIHRVMPDGSHHDDVIVDGIGLNGIKSIAVDWIAGNLYFINMLRTETFIEAARLDGRHRLVLIQDSQNSPSALAVNPIKRYLYWVDGGQFPKIERSNLDGSHRVAMVTENVVQPRSITVDIFTHDVYWTDSSVDAIQKVTFHGGNRQIVRSNLPNPLSLAVFKKDLYWIDRSLKIVFKSLKSSKSVLAKVLKRGLSTLQDITLFHDDIQPNATNPCSSANGGCEQLCFAIPDMSKPKCACAVGERDVTQKKCKAPPAFLIYAAESDILSSSLDLETKSSPIISKHNISGAVALDFDFNDGTIFFSAIGIKQLGEVQINSTEVKNLTQVVNSGGKSSSVPLPPTMGEGVAYDWVNERLYWADSSVHQILSMNKNGTGKTVTAVVHSPRAVAVDPCRGFLFWSQWGIIAQIERSSLGGDNQKAIVRIDLGWPNGLAIDYLEEKLYWVDAKEDRIERCNLEGGRREIIVRTTVHPFSLVIHGRFIYWTDWILHGVYRAEKHTGAGLTVVTEGLTKRPMGITVYRNRTDLCTANPCSMYNGGCQELCQGKQGKATCLCRDPQLVPSNGGKTCAPANHTCQEDQFVCGDGKCVGRAWVCNQRYDCPNGEDEGYNMCATRDCGKGFFRCSGGNCIPQHFVCDHDYDCKDKSDEIGCSYPMCDHTQFMCLNFRCISLSLKCNGIDDCRDGEKSDELMCPPVVCRPGLIKCPNANICVPRKYLCDGDNDCGNGEDESLMFCQDYKCAKDDFHCGFNHRCVPGSWVCDGDNDCGMWEDEANCTVTSRSCQDGQVTCSNGKCIPEFWLCDGTDDCGDLSDEKVGVRCDRASCPANTTFTCTSHVGIGRHPCINISKVCDGAADCVDNEDELDCKPKSCGSGQLRCANGNCVPRDFRCDRVDDCGDNSDEPSDCVYSTCTGGHFTCDNNRCIPKHWTCDKEDDCLDFSDEKPALCSHEKLTCGLDMFKCGDSKCINQSNVCDGQGNCADWSDERSCGVDECQQNSTNRCSQICTDQPSGYRCSCEKGFLLEDNKKTCRDIDECREQPGACSQICVNNEGSFTCKCNDGYKKLGDNRGCKKTDNATPWLLFTNSYYIREVTTNGTSFQQIADDFNNAVAIDFLYSDGMLYFSDVATKTIHQMALNGTEHHVIIKNGINSLEGIAVDWVGRKLYWIDAKSPTISVAEINGTSQKTLLKKGILGRPRALVVNPFTGYCYWTDWSSNAYIGQIGMDGSQPKKLITKKIGWPNALTMDFETNRLWWADAHLDWIEYANADGSNRHMVKRKVPHAFAITMFEDWLYWTDWNHLTLEKCNKFTGENHSIMLNTTHRPMDIHVYHPLRQKKGNNPCGEDNGGCSHLCLIAPGGGNFSCACPDNFLFSNDNKTCEANCSFTQIRCGKSDDRCISRLWKCDGSRDCKDGSDEPDTCPVTDCSPGQFRCRNGNCTYGFQTCDLIDQCGDGSDEEECENRECESWQFRCKNHKCIPAGWKCDDVNDCGDNSDESSTICHKRKCESGKFTCDNGRCIPLSWQCDFDDDCGDNSDEKPEFSCQNRTCRQGWWKCQSNYRCIPDWQRCNGRDDCRDNSDEQVENCPECHPTGDFTCNNKRCVPKRWMCDFYNDCGDSSDEDTQMCAPLYRNCSESEIRCKNQKCIRSKWKCDHDNDCGDNSDEDPAECKTYKQCGSGQFQCANGHCIDQTFTCNGASECGDYSDEVNCTAMFPEGRYCPTDMFQCDNHECIPMSWRCDARDDCGDQSDESIDVCDSLTCHSETHFRCTNRKCIPKWMKCDHLSQCGDGSDENKTTICKKEPEPCSSDQFKCQNNQCISAEFVCDNFKDCADESDEIGCNKTHGHMNCSHENGGCGQDCTDIEGGYICSCKKGFKHAKDDRKSCEDKDECSNFSNGCPQKCNNVKGSYKCQCAKGFRDTKGGGKDCKAEEYIQTILFSSLDEIRRYRPDRKHYSGVVTRGHKIAALDVDIGRKLIYWTDSEKRQLLRAPMPEKPDRLGLAQNIGIQSPHPHGIVVDWVESNIYWTDIKLGTVSVCLFDGRYHKTLVTNVGEPLAVAVNPKLGIMYWTDAGADEPKIEQAWMNGERRKVLISTKLGRPSALTIDYLMSDRVFWADYKLGIVESMKFDGTDRSLVAINMNSPVSLDVFESRLYWISQRNESAYHIDKFGLSNATILQTGLTYPGGVRIYHHLRVDLEVKPRCPSYPNKCSHLCLLVPDSYQCACPEGTTFQGDSTFVCNAATEVEKPLPQMCSCWHGGECIKLENGSYICKCLKGFSGDLCENIEPKKLSTDLSLSYLALILIPSVMLFLLAMGIVIVLIRRRTLINKLKQTGVVKYKEEGTVEITTPHQISQHAQVETAGGVTNFSNPMYETLQGGDPNSYLKGMSEISLGEDGSQEAKEMGQAEGPASPQKTDGVLEHSGAADLEVSEPVPSISHESDPYTTDTAILVLNDKNIIS